MKKLLLFSFLFVQVFLSAQNPIICSSNSVGGADFCGAACLHCHLEGLMGSTAGYTSQTPPGWCGSIENEQWFQFIPTCTSLSFIATPSNCFDENGLQIGIYTSCSSFPIACDGGGSGQGSTPVVVTANVVPGQLYYLVIDGWAGDQCDFTLSAVLPNCILSAGTGGSVTVTNPNLLGPDTLCIGNTGNYAIDGVSGGNFFFWDGPAGTRVNGWETPVALGANSQNTWEVRMPLAYDSIQVNVRPVDICGDTTGAITLSKVIYSQPAPTVTLPDTSFCSSQLVLPWGQTVYGSGVYYGPVAASAIGCDTVGIMAVQQIPGAPTYHTIVKVICPGEFVQVFSQVFATPGVYTVQGIGTSGCDSIVRLELYDIQQYAQIMANIPGNCYNENTRLYTTSPPPNLNLDYKWMDINGNFLSDNSYIDPHIVFPLPGSYIILQVSYVDAVTNCSANDTIQMGALANCHSVYVSDLYDCQSQNIQLTLDFSPADSSYVVTLYKGTDLIGTGLSYTLPTLGIYTARVEEAGGCIQDFPIYVYPLAAQYSQVSGTVYEDLDGDCQLSVGDIPANQALFNFSRKGNPFSNYVQVKADSLGKFRAYLLPGTYETDVSNNVWVCPLTITANQCDNSDSLVILVKSLDSCQLGNIASYLTPLERCFNQEVTIAVGNEGALPLINATLAVKTDPLLPILGSDFPILSQTPDSILINIGNLNTFQTELVTVYVAPDCNAPLGTIHCIEGNLYPASNCPQYSGPALRVKGDCIGDSIRFEVMNQGSAMQTPTDWYYGSIGWPTVNGSGNLQLAFGESFFVTVPAAQNMYFVVNQVSTYPFGNEAGVAVSNCNQDPSLAVLVSDLSSLEISSHFRYCAENTGSFDPNDKQGLPEGIGAEHYIAEGSDLTYRIRFQNTGTAAARNVRLIDTLSPLLNWRSLEPIGASHDMIWNISPEGVLYVYFNDINLPDSFTNAKLSQGFFSYRISQWQSNPFGAKIENTAAIYFDFNPPIFTNTTLHTNGIPRPSGPSSTTEPVEIKLKLSPNPFSDQCRVELSQLEFAAGETLIGELYDAFGKLIITQQVTGTTLTFNQLGGLHSGLYVIAIRDKASGRYLAVAKAVKI